jgi:hypothetical protein
MIIYCPVGKSKKIFCPPGKLSPVGVGPPVVKRSIGAGCGGIAEKHYGASQQ